MLPKNILVLLLNMIHNTPRNTRRREWAHASLSVRERERERVSVCVCAAVRNTRTRARIDTRGGRKRWRL